MKLFQKSGPALFMYSVIAIGILTSVLTLGAYYGGKTDSRVIMWIGIVAIMIVYHFWVRIIMGNISKLFKKHLSYKQWWFKEKKFEKGLYKFLKVKEWKGKALTYNPESFSVKDNSLETLANTMTKSEWDHWMNELISVCSIFFAFIFKVTVIPFLISAIAAMIFDSQFIVIQRYNRPRIVKLLERQERESKREKVEA